MDFFAKNIVKQLRIGFSSGVVKPLSIGVLILIPLAIFLAECSGGGGGVAKQDPGDSSAHQVQPFEELIQQGVSKYLGVYSPMLATSAGGVTTHTFGGDGGPVCFDNSDYVVMTRDLGSEDLLIFLQGGGACWSDICQCKQAASQEIPCVGILDPNLPENPVKAWNTVFIPYCDGSHFSGNADQDIDGDGIIDQNFRGLKNLSAALDVTQRKFPVARRILLAGVSAGGFGTAYALPLVRHLYPDVPIFLINDSGVGILPPDFIANMLSDWHAGHFLPASCPDCLDENGYLTNYHSWQLTEDNLLRTGFMSYKRDAVIADFYSDMGGDFFEQALVEEMSKLEALHPERMHSFIVDGAAHSFITSSLTVKAGEVSVAQWLTDMLENSPDWQSATD